MRTIFIISHAPVEFAVFEGHDFEIKNITVTNDANKLIFVFNADLTIEKIELIKHQVVLDNNDTLILFHGEYDNFNLPASLYRFNVGTNGYSTMKDTQRWYYEKLLANKLAVFDEVWNYFHNKTKQHELYVLKTSFLDDEIYKNTCPITLPSELETPELVLLFDPIKGKEFNRADQTYMVYFEKFKYRLNELYQDV